MSIESRIAHAVGASRRCRDDAHAQAATWSTDDAGSAFASVPPMGRENGALSATHRTEPLPPQDPHH